MVARMLDLPPCLETSRWRWLPTLSGSMCSYVCGSFRMAEAWMPALVAKALSPTYGRVAIGVAVQHLIENAAGVRQRA